MSFTIDEIGDFAISVLMVTSALIMIMNVIVNIRTFNYGFNTLKDKTDTRHYIAYNDENHTYFPLTREQISFIPLINNSKDEFSVYAEDIITEDGNELQLSINVKPIYNEASEEFNPIEAYDRIPPVSVFNRVGDFYPLPKSLYGMRLVYSPNIGKSPDILFFNERKEH